MKRQVWFAVVMALLLTVGFGSASFSFAHAAAGNRALYNQTSDPVFLELEALKKRIGRVEGRVGSVEKKVQELVKVGQAKDASIDAILAGDQPQWVVVSFGSNHDIEVGDLAKILRFTKQKWTVAQIVLVPVAPGDDKEAAEIVNENRTETLEARYFGLHRVATAKEAEMLRAKGIVGAIIKIVPPAAKAAATAPSKPTTTP